MAGGSPIPCWVLHPQRTQRAPRRSTTTAGPRPRRRRPLCAQTPRRGRRCGLWRLTDPGSAAAATIQADVGFDAACIARRGCCCCSFVCCCVHLDHCILSQLHCRPSAPNQPTAARIDAPHATNPPAHPAALSFKVVAGDVEQLTDALGVEAAIQVGTSGECRQGFQGLGEGALWLTGRWHVMAASPALALQQLTSHPTPTAS